MTQSDFELYGNECAVCGLKDVLNLNIERHVLSDHRIFPEDLYSLEADHQLTNNTLHIWSQMCMTKLLASALDACYTKDDIHIIPPSICHLIKICESETETASIVASMNLNEKELLIFFISDATATSTGSHWSLMVYSKKKIRFTTSIPLKTRTSLMQEDWLFISRCF